ncbi:MAG: hydratase, partial [Lachnospiraceae bacterium]|nr:hydratase [Lachnospiraceae bacterium]
KDPAYVGRAKNIRKAEKARWKASSGDDITAALPEIKTVLEKVSKDFGADPLKLQVGSVIYAVKPGDGSAREQAASCQKVLGGLANIAHEYATKRYRSNLINWGMIPFLFDSEADFEVGDYLFVKDIKDAIVNKRSEIKAYIVNKDNREITLKIGELTDDEREIIVKGCLINYYRG